MVKQTVKYVLAVVGVGLSVTWSIYGLTPLGLLGINLSTLEGVLLVAVMGLLGGAAGYLLAPWLIETTVSAVQWLETKLSETPVQDIMIGVIGVIIGLILANLIGSAFQQIPVFGTILSTAGSVILGYLGWVTGVRKRQDIFQWVQNIGGSPKQVPPVAAGENEAGSSGESGLKPKILDTSVIIDGRIVEICESGFMEGPLVIPDFVLDELQAIADSSDRLKRNRGRRGLDVLGSLQEGDVSVDFWQGSTAAELDVDHRLIELAKELDGKVVTNDYNLNKVTRLQGIPVLNVNDLANAVKPVVLPGEELDVKLIKPGKERGQGVGYLDDGTMIVVDGGKDHIGSQITAQVTSVLQTSAGRMIFAEPSSGMESVM